MNPFFLLIRNLLLTVLIEGLLVLVFAKRRSTVFHSVLVNMLTNPLVNLCLMIFVSAAIIPMVPYYAIFVAFLELAAFITEAILYNKMGDFSIKKAFLASFLLNAVSFSFGFLLQ